MMLCWAISLLLKKIIALFGRERSGLSGLEIAEFNAADTNPLEGADSVSKLAQHYPDLVAFALVEDYPERISVYDLCFGREKFTKYFCLHARLEYGRYAGPQRFFDDNNIFFLVLFFFGQYFPREAAVICQEQKPFRLFFEPSDGIKP